MSITDRAFFGIFFIFARRFCRYLTRQGAVRALPSRRVDKAGGRPYNFKYNGRQALPAGGQGEALCVLRTISLTIILILL